MTGTAVLPCRDGFRPPADAGELFTRDGEYIRGMVRNRLGPEASAQDVEDAAADIIEKLVRRDVIGMYDPGHQSALTGKAVPWRTFLGRQVELYSRWKRDQVSSRLRREVYAPAGDDGTWVEAVTGSSWDAYPSMTDSQVVARLREHLASVPRSWSGPVSLAELFDLMVARAGAGERVTRAVVEEEFGVSPAAARRSLSRLRGFLKAVRHAAPPPAVSIAGVAMTAAQAAQAADALEESRGNRVSPALAAIGSPLAGLSTRQYIALGKAELKSYPGCKVARGTRHGSHSSQTKVALVHLLRRAAGGQAAPVTPAPGPAEEPPAPAEVLEAELWHFPGMTPDRVEYLLGLARSAYGPPA